MKAFALDLWQDLRDKRLWPVAILLVVALVAIPFVLRQPADETAPATASVPAASAAAADAGAQELAIKALQEGTGPPSQLDTFSEKNPFKPLVKDASVADVADALDTPSGVSGETGAGGGGDTGSTETGGTDSGDTGGTGETPDDDTADPGDDEPKTIEYTYVLDITFTANGRKRDIDGMQKLDILPNEASPLLIFMGVTDSAGNAVFLVDSTLQTVGEGKCKPSRSECAFLYLGAGAEQEFTTEEGDSYRLLVDQIRKVKVGDEASSSKGKSAKAAVGAPPAPRRFAVPILADLLSVSSGAGGHSNSDQDRR
jgi:hypothetical protein